MIVLRPSYDSVTCRISLWGKEIIEELKDRQYSYVDCYGSNVTRGNLMDLINSNSVKSIIFYGHGDGSEWFGHKEEVIIDNNNSHILAGKFVYDVSCESGTKFRQMAMDNGAACYVGYETKFKLNLKELESSDEDFFKIGANFMLKEMIKHNNSAREAYESAQKKYDDLILQLEQKYKDEPSDSLAIKYLFAVFSMSQNKKGFILDGNKDFRFHVGFKERRDA